MYLSFHRTVILLTKNITNEALTLETSALQLSEVVVTGQAVGIERKRLTSSVDVITADQISSAPVVRLDQMPARYAGAFGFRSARYGIYYSQPGSDLCQCLATQTWLKGVLDKKNNARASVSL